MMKLAITEFTADSKCKSFFMGYIDWTMGETMKREMGLKSTLQLFTLHLHITKFSAGC